MKSHQTSHYVKKHALQLSCILAVCKDTQSEDVALMLQRQLLLHDYATEVSVLNSFEELIVRSLDRRIAFHVGTSDCKSLKPIGEFNHSFTGFIANHSVPTGVCYSYHQLEYSSPSFRQYLIGYGKEDYLGYQYLTFFKVNTQWVIHSIGDLVVVRL